jgi:hypothetical protein
MLMSESRRQDGRETWNRLLEWDKGQAPSERLAARLLSSENYSNINPSHPLGGKDGGKDAFVEKDGLKLILAVYFPRGKKTIQEITKKFRADFEGVSKNKSDGIIFFTNQELTLSEQNDLKAIAKGSILDLYYLERIGILLDVPRNYGLRLEFLQISMTHEEMLAFYKQRDEEYLTRLAGVTNELQLAVDKILGNITGGSSFPIVVVYFKKLLLKVEGDFPLKSVHIKIFDKIKLDKKLSKKTDNFEIDTLYHIKQSCKIIITSFEIVNVNDVFFLYDLPLMKDDEKKHFQIEIQAMNGKFFSSVFVKNIKIESELKIISFSYTTFKEKILYQKKNDEFEFVLNESYEPQEW